MNEIKEQIRYIFQLNKAYDVNAIHYRLRRIPIIKKLFWQISYGNEGYKTLLTILFFFFSFMKNMLLKGVYFGCLIGISYLCLLMGDGILAEADKGALFLHYYIILTLYGAIFNNTLFQCDEKDRYAIVFLKMNPMVYFLTNYGKLLLKVLLFYWPYGVLACWLFDLPFWMAFVLGIFTVAVKIVVQMLNLVWAKKRKNYVVTGVSMGGLGLILCIFLLVALLWHVVIFWYCNMLEIAMLPAYQFHLSTSVAYLVMASTVVVAIPCFWHLIKKPEYRLYYHNSVRNSKELEQANVSTQMARTKHIREVIGEESIQQTSSKKGLEYLNEIFIKRHRRLLWRPSIICSILVLIVLAGFIAVMVIWKESRDIINRGALLALPAFSFVMYLINRGKSFTEALFMNCDHSMLTFSVYKKPSTILKLFMIRLREITKVNLPPALLIAVGFDFVLWFSGGTEQTLNYVIIFVSILLMSFFFSLHYLTMYYLLQPYTIDIELKSVPYNILLGVTYYACYMLMQMRFSVFYFGLAMIGFCVVYSIVAGGLVYMKAPKTFRLK